MEKDMSNNTSLEVALEILSAKIADTSKRGYSIEDEEIKILLNEREKMYSGDEEVIDKIIKIYGPEVKRNYEGA